MRAWLAFWYGVWRERRHGRVREIHQIEHPQYGTPMLVMHPRTLEHLLTRGSVRPVSHDDAGGLDMLPALASTLTGLDVVTNPFVPEFAGGPPLTDELGVVIGGPRWSP